MLLTIAVLSLFGLSSQVLLTRDNRQTYRAAVYEHAIILPPQPYVKVSREQALHNMIANINVYETQVSEAARQGVDIIVFPEDGIYGYQMITRDTIAPYLEYIPDPKLESWTPCVEPGRHNNTDVQVLLSCLARNHSIYLVANIGDAQPCVKADPNCKSDGQYQYNTDVVFDRSGKLIAKYHKQNLFFEYQFDEPVNPEYIYFDTDFGRFGIFTCFDILFHEPAIPLIEEYNITDVVFPTAWMDALPFFSAIGYHSSFAIANKVNFLAANLHRPQERFQGSGIYTPKGPIRFFYNRTSDEGHLVVADVPVLQRKAGSSNLQKQPPIHFVSKKNHWASSDDFGSTSFHGWYNFVLIRFFYNRMSDEGHLVVADVPVLQRKAGSSNLQKQPPIHFVSKKNHWASSDDFRSTSFHDWYNFVLIGSEKGSKRVCQMGLCCYLEYERDDSGEMYAMGVFDGIHQYNGPYYLQICILLRCPSMAKDSCGSLNFNANTRFNQFKLYGNFSTPYVNPQVVLSNNGSLELAPIGSVQYDSYVLEGNSIVTPLLSASLVGRIYVRD